MTGIEELLSGYGLSEEGHHKGDFWDLVGLKRGFLMMSPVDRTVAKGPFFFNSS